MGGSAGVPVCNHDVSTFASLPFAKECSECGIAHQGATAAAEEVTGILTYLRCKDCDYTLCPIGCARRCAAVSARRTTKAAPVALTDFEFFSAGRSWKLIGSEAQ